MTEQPLSLDAAITAHRKATKEWIESLESLALAARKSLLGYEPEPQVAMPTEEPADPPAPKSTRKTKPQTTAARRRRLVDYLEKNGPSSSVEIRDQLKLSTERCRVVIRQSLDDGEIIKLGKRGPGVKYSVPGRVTSLPNLGVLDLLARRPLTFDEMNASTSRHPQDLLFEVKQLAASGKIRRRRHDEGPDTYEIATPIRREAP